MHAQFDMTSLAYIAVALLTGAYFLAAATDNVMGSDSFGTIPTMIILIAGACLTLFLMEYWRIPVGNAMLRMAACIVGAFLCLAFLAVLRFFARRLHY